jgi:hypothetical protein
MILKWGRTGLELTPKEPPILFEKSKPRPEVLLE